MKEYSLFYRPMWEIELKIKGEKKWKYLAPTDGFDVQSESIKHLKAGPNKF